MKNFKLNTLLMTTLIPMVSIASGFQAQSKMVTELVKRVEFQSECENNKTYLERDYTIRCEQNYHHYNSKGIDSKTNKPFYNRDKAIEHGKVRIAEFNVLHPGMGKTRFKDFRRIAQIMNEFDVVGVTELIPLMGDDFAHNQKLLDFLSTAPMMIQGTKNEIEKLKDQIRNSRRSTLTKKRKLKLQQAKLVELKKDLKEAKNLYREPGYLKILDALHKLNNGKGREWSLILSPRGEGPITSNTYELVGYYYRTSLVKPKVNKYCRQSRNWGRAIPYACIINMDAKDMGEDKSSAFSRRPFLAEFISGKFSFSLITSHVLFDSPKSPEGIKFIMNKAFGVDTYENLGTGITKSNYARFAEVKMTLDFIEKNLKGRGHQKDIIFMGDFNLEKSNPFWSEVLKSWNGAHVFVDDKTSLSVSKFNGAGEPTFGQASNYDHFVFDPAETDECLSQTSQGSNPDINGGAYNFIKDKWSRYLNRSYKVRKEEYIEEHKEEGDLEVLDPQYVKNERKYNWMLKEYIKERPKTLTIGRKSLVVNGHKISTRGIIEDSKENADYEKYFIKRVMDSQLNDSTYYYYFEQLLSDHYPIEMTCSNN